MLEQREAKPDWALNLDFSMQPGGAMGPGARTNVAFSCRRGLAS